MSNHTIKSYDFTSALLNNESVLSYKAQVNLTRPFLIKTKARNNSFLTQHTFKNRFNKTN